MTPYPGANAPVVPVVPGQGAWSTVQIMEGGDPRSAAFLMAGVMSLTDRVNLLYDRGIDMKSGGTFTLGGDVTINTGPYVWTWEGSMNIAPGAGMGMLGHMIVGDSGGNAGDGTIFLGFPFAGDAHVLLANGSDITIQPGGTLACSGTAAHPTVCTFSGDSGSAPNCIIALVNKAAVVLDATSPLTCGGPVTLSGTTTQFGPYIKSGTSARTELRVATLPNTDGATFDASRADIWEVPTGLGGGIGVWIAQENTNFMFIIRQKNANQGGDVTIFNHDGGVELGTFKDFGGGSIPPQFLAEAHYTNRAVAGGTPFLGPWWDGTGTVGGDNTTPLFVI